MFQVIIHIIIIIHIFFLDFCPSIVHTRSLKQQYSYTEVVVERRVGNPPTILYKKLKGEKNDNIA